MSQVLIGRFWKVVASTTYKIASARHELSLNRKRGLVSVQCGLLKNFKGPIKKSRIILRNFKSLAFNVLTHVITILLLVKSNLVRQCLLDTVILIKQKSLFCTIFHWRGPRLYYNTQRKETITTNSPL